MANKATYLAVKKKGGGLIKIGKSSNINQRSNQLNSKMIYTIDGDFEKELHEFFEHKRIDGEWFLLSDDDIEYVKSRYKEYQVESVKKTRIDMPADVNTIIQNIQAESLIKFGVTISKQDVIIEIIRNHGK